MTTTWRSRYQNVARAARDAGGVARENAAMLDRHRETALASHAQEVAGLDREGVIYDDLRRAADNRLAYETGALGRERLLRHSSVCAKPEFHDALAALADKAANGVDVSVEDWCVALDQAAAFPDPIAMAYSLANRDEDCLAATEAAYGRLYGAQT